LNALLCTLALGGTTFAQQDTTGFGGPDGEDIYTLLLSEEEAVTGFDMLRDVNDSLAHIPWYDLYCTWNTETIFDRGRVPVIKDTLRLQLSHHECDHALPCSGHVTSPFGPRRGRMHYGVDLKLQTGDPVQVAFDGIVRISRYNSTFGHVVVVRHYNGLETLYAHLSKRLVGHGDRVKAGDLIGLGGNTGRSYGSHLHFEVRFMDQPIDPALVFDLESGILRDGSLEINPGLFERIAAARAEAAASKYHVVRSGDTLSAIARRYGTSVPVLCRLNGMRQTSVLRVGQRVRYR
jgi:murein DD-endopeptidase MepM/ murein hydrolase activator NlpD